MLSVKNTIKIVRPIFFGRPKFVLGIDSRRWYKKTQDLVNKRTPETRELTKSPLSEANLSDYPIYKQNWKPKVAYCPLPVESTRHVLKAKTCPSPPSSSLKTLPQSNGSPTECTGVDSPPPPPPPPPKQTQWKYILLLLFLSAAGGLGLAWHNDMFDSSNKKNTSSSKKLRKRKTPLSSADIPKEVPYLLIGGGTASFSAFRAIKSHEPKAKVMVISSELEMPYMRPPLSKELWYGGPSPSSPQTDNLKFKQWNGIERSLFYEPDDFYVDPAKLSESVNGGVAIVRGYTVKSLDICDRKATLNDGTEIKYGECLIATGSLPKNLDVFNAATIKIKERITLFKTIEDFEQLKATIDRAKTVAVVGGGFLGSELSCALARYGQPKGLQVHQIFHESGNMGKVLPEYLSQWTTDRVAEEGVQVETKSQIKAVTMENDRIRLSLIDGKSILVDHVIVAVGSKPNTALATSSGLEIHSKLGGYVVNAELEARRHVYVAGDAACFYDPKLGRRRVEHHDHAVVSGRLAGENMVGLKKPYTHQSMFWSDLGPNVGYEAIGLVDSTLPTVGVFAKQTEQELVENKANSKITANPSPLDPTVIATPLPGVAAASTTANNYKSSGENDNFGKGVVFYLRDDKVVGIVLWNVFNRINIARKVIGEDKKYDDLNEVAKLFDIHEQN